MTQNKPLLLGLAAASLPLPILCHLSGLFLPASVTEAALFYLFFSGVPALFLFFGYRHLLEKKDVSKKYFISGAAVVGIVIGLIVIVPLSLPLIYFRADGESALMPLSQLMGILSLITFLSIFYAFVFWLIAVYKTKSEVPR